MTTTATHPDRTTTDAPRPAPTAPEGAAPHARLVIYVLALGVFLMGTTEFIVAPLLPAIGADLGVGTAKAGLSITVFAAGMIVGAPLTAIATLRVPQRTTLVAALLVFAAGHALAAVAPSLGLLLAARFLTALATGACWATATVVASRVAGPARAAGAVGVVNAGGMLATVVGVPAGAVVGQAMGWRGSFWGLAVLAVLAALPIARFVPGGGARVGEVSISGELKALRSAPLWCALAASAGATGGTLAVYSYIAPLLTGRTGFSEAAVPLVLAAFGAGSLIGSLVGGRLGDHTPYRTIVTAALATLAVLAGLAVLSTSPVATVVLVSLLGLFGLGANPVLMALAVKFSTHAPTLGSSLSVAAFNTGTAIASWAGGIALASSLGDRGPIAVGVAIVTLSLVPILALARHGRRLGPGGREQV